MDRKRAPKKAPPTDCLLPFRNQSEVEFFKKFIEQERELQDVTAALILSLKCLSDEGWGKYQLLRRQAVVECVSPRDIVDMSADKLDAWVEARAHLRDPGAM